MFTIGCHLSSSKGYANMAREAARIGGNTFQFFTRNPRGSKAKAIDEKDIEAFKNLALEHQIQKIVAHAPYTLNACSAEARTREFALEVMADDLRRMELIPHNYYNFHSGSHVGQGIDTGIALIAETLNIILKPEQQTLVLLETMSGKGSEVGGAFEELKRIIEQVELSDKLGVCLDTCHVYDAGYDIVNHLDDVLAEFDDVIGLERLYAIHLNDSKNPWGSRKDRHEKIGEGAIGMEAIIGLINHPKLRQLPFLLETPNEIEGYEGEIRMLRNAYKE